MSGKSGALQKLRERFESRGDFTVIVAPEIATQTINNGFHFYKYQETEQKAAFNYHVAKLQQDLETYYTAW